MLLFLLYEFKLSKSLPALVSGAQLSELVLPFLFAPSPKPARLNASPTVLLCFLLPAPGMLSRFAAFMLSSAKPKPSEMDGKRSRGLAARC